MPAAGLFKLNSKYRGSKLVKILGNVHQYSKQIVSHFREKRQKGTVLNLAQLGSHARGTILGTTQISIQLCGSAFEIL